MISSRIFIGIFITILISEYCKAAECGPNRSCKYGGVCGPDNQCRCVMTCTPPSWTFDKQNMYCLPRQGQRPEIFFNICYLLSAACERQEDIPLIKFDINTQRCDVSKEMSEKLCPSPAAFMGQCGGTLVRTNHASSYEGGICLKSPGSASHRCMCPKGRVGSQCEAKSLFSNVTEANNNKEAKIIGVSIGASVGAAVLVCALIRRWRRCKSKQNDKHSTAEEGAVAECNHKTKNSNRDDNEITSVRSTSITSLSVTSEEKPAPSSLAKTKSEITKANPSSESPRRQRLAGLSIRNVEDSNNNLGIRQPIGNTNITVYGTTDAIKPKVTLTMVDDGMQSTSNSQHEKQVDRVEVV